MCVYILNVRDLREAVARSFKKNEKLKVQYYFLRDIY